MRTCDRIVIVAALGLALGLRPDCRADARCAFDGTTRPPAEPCARACRSAAPCRPCAAPAGHRSRALRRRAVAAAGACAAAAIPNAALPRPRAPVPVLTAPAATLDRPLPPPTASRRRPPRRRSRRSAPARGRCKRRARSRRRWRRCNMPPSRAWSRRSGSSAACMPRATASTQYDLRAFEYFSRIANGYADDNPGGPRGALRRQCVRGARPLLPRRHPGYRRARRPGRARADVRLRGVLFRRSRRAVLPRRGSISTSGPPRDPRQAARWLHAAANKGQYQAQAVLGRMLFKGEHVPRQAARGLMWLALARDQRRHRRDLDRRALRGGLQAGDRRRARDRGRYAGQWMNGRRD